MTGLISSKTKFTCKNCDCTSELLEVVRKDTIIWSQVSFTHHIECPICGERKLFNLKNGVTRTERIK